MSEIMVIYGISWKTCWLLIFASPKHWGSGNQSRRHHQRRKLAVFREDLGTFKSSRSDALHMGNVWRIRKECRRNVEWKWIPGLWRAFPARPSPQQSPKQWLHVIVMAVETIWCFAPLWATGNRYLGHSALNTAGNFGETTELENRDWTWNIPFCHVVKMLYHIANCIKGTMVDWMRADCASRCQRSDVAMLPRSLTVLDT